MTLQELHKDAIALLHRLVTPQGLLASTIAADNYKRVWARDAMVCGLAGIVLDDPIILEGLKNSLLTLAKYQHQQGIIPSNVDPNTGDTSFGSLVGRIDANTWFLVGACLYYKHTQDLDTWQTLLPVIKKNRAYLNTLEFNAKGWLYTPLSGNWADEYPIHGYTLYDNALRLWGERLLDELLNTQTHTNEARFLANFWPDKEVKDQYKYHEAGFKAALKEESKHYTAFILPGYYDQRFDAAANGLALLQWPLDSNKKLAIQSYLTLLKEDLGAKLIPAFWPIISTESEDWYLLARNYSYAFKNRPGAFHNGGIWPVWMGLFAMGLSAQDMQQEAQEITKAFVKQVGADPQWDFQEYLNASSLKFQGKTQMGYTASGIVFLNAAITGNSNSIFGNNYGLR